MSKNTIIIVLSIFIVWPLLIIIPPNVIQDLWLWFIMPVGAGLQPLSFWHAFGLILIMGYFSHPFFQQEVTDYIRKDLSEDEKVSWILKRGLQGVFFALFVWGIGALVSYGV